MEWVVTLDGDEIDLQELAKVWNTPELTIEKDNSTYILKSSHFASLTDQEICEKVNELLVPLNAGIILNLGALNPIKIGSIMQINTGGTRILLPTTYAICKVRVFACISKIDENGKPEIHYPADPIIPLFRLAQSDQQVAKMCHYINQNLDSWYTLADIVEILQEDEWEHTKKKGGKYSDECKRLTGTAHKFRHAKTQKGRREMQVPPMTLSEAQYFIKKIVKEWIESKRNAF